MQSSAMYLLLSVKLCLLKNNISNVFLKLHHSAPLQ